MALSEAAKEARRKYEREYWAKHPEKARGKARRYWERKAEKNRAEQETAVKSFDASQVRKAHGEGEDGDVGMSEWKVPVQSLIDHIETAVDVDPWAKEMAEELLKEQEPKLVLSERKSETMPFRYERKGFCPTCHQVISWTLNRSFCGFCGQKVKWDD